MTFFLLLIPFIACLLICNQNVKAEKLVRAGKKEEALASSWLDDFYTPMILVGCAILFYVAAYLVFPVK